jgi:hypothetical protein
MSHDAGRQAVPRAFSIVPASRTTGNQIAWPKYAPQLAVDFILGTTLELHHHLEETQTRQPGCSILLLVWNLNGDRSSTGLEVEAKANASC